MQARHIVLAVFAAGGHPDIRCIRRACGDEAASFDHGDSLAGRYGRAPTAPGGNPCAEGGHTPR